MFRQGEYSNDRTDPDWMFSFSIDHVLAVFCLPKGEAKVMECKGGTTQGPSEPTCHEPPPLLQEIMAHVKGGFPQDVAS